MELVIEGLGKTYGKQTALRGVSLRSGPGMLGLVGPNGAGKTTLMRIIATLLDQSSGQASWNGHDTRKQGAAIRQVLGYLPQEFGLYPELSARQFLRYLAAMKRLPANLATRRVDEVLELVNLEREADRRLRGYSGGMKQRVGIAQALLNDPELLIVDEPTAGLDPAERVRFRTLLGSLTANRLIILSTHIIADVEAVASRLVVLKDGQVRADTTPEALMQQATGKVWALTTEPATAQELQRQQTVSGLLTTPDGITVRIVSPARPHRDAQPIEPSLEDAYLLAVNS